MTDTPPRAVDRFDPERLAVDPAERTYWILTERGSRLSARMPNLAVGPFHDPQEAINHLESSMQIESICQDGAEECWADTDTAAMEALTAWTKAGEPFELYQVIKDDEEEA